MAGNVDRVRPALSDLVAVAELGLPNNFKHRFPHRMKNPGIILLVLKCEKLQ